MADNGKSELNSAISMIAYFEPKSNPLYKPFYFEDHTVTDKQGKLQHHYTINFGFGSNLTDSVDANNQSIKVDYGRWFEDNNIDLSDIWSKVSLKNGSISAKNGQTIIEVGNSIANDLNAALATGDYTATARSIATSYINTIVDKELGQEISNFAGLPSLEKAALENIDYDTPKLLGSNVYGDASRGDRAGVAEELAFKSEKAQANQGGLEERFLGSGLLALGAIPTYNDSNHIIINVTIDDAKVSDIKRFLEDVFTKPVGHDGETAENYVTKWGQNPAVSYHNIVHQLDEYLRTKGEYVANPDDDDGVSNGNPNVFFPADQGDDGTGVDEQNVTFPGANLTLYNASAYKGVLSGFTAGVTLDLASVGMATGATISGNVLSVQGAAGGTININLDPSRGYGNDTPSVADDGNGGTNVTLAPAVPHTITFSEYALGTINPVYTFPDETVNVVGEILRDDAQPASPVIAANTNYVGPVFINFVFPVTHVEFDAGYFDELGSTTITFIGTGGNVLQTSTNSQYGVAHYSYDNASGIAAVNVVNTGFDGNGFSVDTVTFSGEMAAAPADTTVSIAKTNSVAEPGDPVFTYTVTRTGDLSVASTVGYAVVGSGDNPLGAADVPGGALPVGQIMFTAGQASEDITVDVLGDFAATNPKTFSVILLAPSAATNLGTASVDATLLTPPVIANTMPVQQITDLGATAPFAHTTISDPNDNQSESLTVTLSNSENGIFTNLGGGDYNATTGVYTVAGSADGVTAALEGLVFIPTAQQVDAGKSVTTNFAVQVTDTAGAIVSDADTSVVVTAQLLTAITGDTTGGLTEAATLGVSSAVAGTLHATGIEGATDFSLVKDGTFGTLAITPQGAWTYTLDNANPTVDGLSTASTPLEDDVTVTTADGTFQLIAITIHGADDVRTGTAGNDLLVGTSGVDTLIGGAGNDMYFVNNPGDVVTEAANAGIDLVHTTLSYALAANVENLVLDGTANINGTGNGLANAIVGNNGNNALSGGSGADTMKGGLGNDTYFVDNVDDVVAEAPNAGTDTVHATINYALPANVENLVLDGTYDISGTGNALNNAIVGNGGNNVLDGGVGADVMAGGLGNDLYYVNNVGDIVKEAANAGSDKVRATINYTLADNVENLILEGSANINGVGNGLNNGIIGNDGNNVIDGRGGADAMTGGLGNDTYFVDSVGDVVSEAANAGTDTVHSTISYALPANTENLVLDGTDNLTGTGNTLSNAMVGNSGNNVLDGGDGADVMAGGLGNDLYHVDNIGDVVKEAANAGSDKVRATISYTLTDNVENLILEGSGNINGTGNALNNGINGNDGNNVLDGRGGADAMAGGVGNDTYYVDNSGDVVKEAANAGTDAVHATVSYALPDNVEYLILDGTGNINATGNGLANAIVGNTGNNVITGGSGADTLKGGAGADTFAYLAASDSTAGAPDLLADFQTGVDKIDLSKLHTSSTDKFTIASSGGYTTVNVDLGGNGTTDMVIRATGTNAIAASDILWTASNVAIAHPIEVEPMVHPATVTAFHPAFADHSLYG